MQRIVFALFLLLASPAFAQDRYPSRAVEIVVPFAAGGGTDLIARVLTDRLSESLKQRFVVINRPGASTNIGTAAVANAAADGYTLLLTSISCTANPSLYRKLSYSQKDFAPIALIANSPSILVVPAAYPINSVAELVAQLKAHPGELNYASYGAGSGPHLAAGLSAQTGKRQGEAGAIVFGGVRDVGHSRSVDYPIWSTELSAVTGKWRLQTIEINGPIQIGGVRVEPGDLVIADETSVCFIPRDRMTDVLALAQEKAEAEDLRCKAIDSGIEVPDISRATYGEKQ